MKKTLTIAALVALWLWTATFAWGGHGQGMWQGRGYGQWQGFGRTLTAEQRAQLQSMSPEERRAYVQRLRQQQGLSTQQDINYMKRGGYHGKRQGRGQNRGNRQNHWQSKQKMQKDPSKMIANYPVSNLTDEEKKGLINQYGEEKMARDVYLYAYEKYGTPVFKNIANSEQQHMNAIKALLDRYGIIPPTDYAKDTELAAQLKAKIDEGLEQALNVGVTVEEVDIKDIAELAKQAAENNAQDLLAVYTNIAGASFNHLKGFLKSLKNSGYILPDVSKYLPAGVTVDQLLQMRGPDAKKLFVDYVKEHYAIDLSKYQQQCQENQATTTMIVSTQSANISNYLNTTKLNVYAGYIKEKYAHKINTFTADKINKVLQKINTLEKQIVSSATYSDEAKRTYITVLEALKKVLQEKMSSDTTSIIDSVLGK